MVLEDILGELSMNRKFFVFFTFLIFLSNALGETLIDVQKNTQKVLDTCQCKQCNLVGANLKDFKPGSSSYSENYLLRSNPLSSMASGAWINCDLSEANLKNANLDSANFRVSYKLTTPLKSATFKNTIFDNASLKNGNFFSNDFQGASFINANLQDSDLTQANLNHANFSNANLSYTSADEMPMSSFGASMRQANFSNANLKNAKLYADFVGANFTGAKLTGARLSTSADVVRNDSGKPDHFKDMFYSVDFTNANLRGATIDVHGDGTLQENLKNAIICQTIMPDGKLNNRDCPTSI